MKACFYILFIISAVNSVQAQPSPSPSPQTPRTPTQSQEEEFGEGEVLRIDANLVSVPVSVVNRSGQYVVDLQRSDFRVFEDGKEQAIVHFSNVDQPFSVVLLIDTSGSTAPFIDQIKGAAKAFVEQLRPADSVRPIYFHGEIKSLADAAIRDPNVFAQAIDQIKPGPINMGTRMYDAVAFGLSTLRPVAGRKAIVLITDGENTWGKATMKGTLRDAEESGAVVYTVQYGDLQTEKYLQQLAEKTGGRYFRGGDLSSITRSFIQVAEELRRQYVLGYKLNNSPKTGTRKITVKVNRKHVVVHSRDSYTYGS